MKRSAIGSILFCWLIAGIGCSAPAPRQGEWLSYEQITPKLREQIRMQPDYLVKACGNLINVGRFKTEKEMHPPKRGEPFEELVVADGSSDFYDRRTSELIAECGDWTCTRNPQFCDRQCPPPEWTCGWEMP
jgi:hypothetical protein